MCRLICLFVLLKTKCKKQCPTVADEGLTDVWGDRMETDAQDGEVVTEVVEGEEAAADEDFFATNKEEEGVAVAEKAGAEETGVVEEVTEADMEGGKEKTTSEPMEDEAEGR